MMPHEEIKEGKRQEDLKSFRRFLVDTGTVKCLVKLYQHTAKHEMRMDNPRVVKDFLAKYLEDDPIAQESQKLTRENETMREYNAVLMSQAAELEQDIHRQARLNLARKLWDALCSREFWGDSAPADRLSLDQLYIRLCGSQVDKVAKVVLVDILRPPCIALAMAKRTITADAFREWVINDADEHMIDWCRSDQLLRCARFKEPPFQQELTKDIYESGVYPDYLVQLIDVVKLQKGLRDFLEAVASRSH